MGITDSAVVAPGPIGRLPETRLLVAAGQHELEKLLIRHRYGIDGKFRDIYRHGGKLVVPTESQLVKAGPQLSATARHGNFFARCGLVKIITAELSGSSLQLFGQ